VKTSSSGRRATSRGRGLAASLVLVRVLAFAVACGSCGGSAPAKGAPPGASIPSLSPPVEFAFESLDARAVTSATTRGKPTVLAFITTSSLSAQAQVDFLIAMAKNDGDHVHYAAVALEGVEGRELVELYEKALSIPFPVALADARTQAGGSGFGDVSAVPVTVLLDGAGRIAWRIDGRVVKSEELRRELRGL
jgi:hypothetical protein